MLVKCSECGGSISDKAATCPNCGAPLTKQGVLRIISHGSKHILNAKYEVYINDLLIGNFSIKQPFKIEMPLDSDTLNLKIKFGFKTIRYTIFLDKTENYTMELSHDNIMGTIRYKIWKGFSPIPNT